MKKSRIPDSVGRDPDLQFLNDLLANKIESTDIQISQQTGVIQKQKYIIQYDEIVQSFDTGLIAMMGLIASVDKNSPCNLLHKDVMDKIDYASIMNRDQSLDIYSFIQQRHKSENVNISNEQMTEIRCEVETKVFEDESGMLINLSPFLVGLNGLINVYLDGNVTKMIFYVNNHKVKNAHASIRDTLQRFFPRNDECPIFIEFSNVSFGKFIKELTEDYKSLDELRDTVVFTTDRNFIEDTVMNESLTGISTVFPQYDCYHLTKDLPTILHGLKPECEYVAYKSKLLKL